MALYWGWVRLPIILLLLLVAAGCYLALRLQGRISNAQLCAFSVTSRDWRLVLRRFALAVPILMLFVLCLNPRGLFGLVLHRPGLWLLVMLAYPVLSVLPQELIYRVFFFDRYGSLFGHGLGLLAANAVAFSVAHILFHNWVAVLLTLVGGWLFGSTYRRTSSMLFTAVEHSLYGCAIFTVGLGGYFLEGTMRLFRGD